MGEQRRIRKGKVVKETLPVDPKAKSHQAAAEDKDRKVVLDKLVDEIDSVLEENAEQFMKNYVQRGGQ